MKVEIIKKSKLYQLFRDTLVFSAFHFIVHIVTTFIRAGMVINTLPSIRDSRRSTLVIAGAGKSVLDFNESDWSNIKKVADIATLSYSVIVPSYVDYFFYEAPSKKHLNYTKEHSTKLLPLVHRKYLEGNLTEAVWKNPDRSNRLIRNTGIPWRNVFTWVVPVDDECKLKKVFMFCRYSGISRKILVQKRATLIGVLNWAIASGYRKIVFSGIDLNSIEYFFENESSYEKYNLTPPVQLYEDDKKYSPVHPSNDPKYGSPIQRILELIISINPDVKFYVTSRRSGIAYMFPLIDPEDI